MNVFWTTKQLKSFVKKSAWRQRGVKHYLSVYTAQPFILNWNYWTLDQKRLLQPWNALAGHDIDVRSILIRETNSKCITAFLGYNGWVVQRVKILFRIDRKSLFNIYIVWIVHIFIKLYSCTNSPLTFSFRTHDHGFSNVHRSSCLFHSTLTLY